MMKTTTKKKTPPPMPADLTASDLHFAERLAALDIEITHLEAKLPFLAARLTEQEAAARAEEERAAALVYRADVDDETGLAEAIEAADTAADRARRDYRRTEHNQREAHGRLAVLRAERRRVEQDHARAHITALEAQRTPYAAGLDQAEQLTKDALEGLARLELEARQLAVTADLPQLEIDRLYRIQRAHVRKILWTMGTLRIGQRPAGARYLADLSHVDIERTVGAGSVADTDNESDADFVHVVEPDEDVA